jgi:hypothetical protein
VRSIVFPLVVVAGLSLVASMGYSAGQRWPMARRQVTREYERLWAEAVEAGDAPAGRKPELLWSAEDMGTIGARTVCATHPIITMNGPATLRDPVFAVYIEVPHELAHALNCTEPWGSSAGHGGYWKAVVYRLVDLDRAQAILAQQRHTEENP